MIARLPYSLSNKDSVLGTIVSDESILNVPWDITRIEDIRARVEALFENV